MDAERAAEKATEARIACLRAAIRAEDGRHRRKMSEIHDELAATQKLCPHRSKTRCMGTPYDSSYQICNICGKEDV